MAVCELARKKPCRCADQRVRGQAAGHCSTRYGISVALLCLRQNRTTSIACTRYGISVALLCLRQNRTTSIACAEEPALIAKILGHVQACDAAVGPDARAPPEDMQEAFRLN
jgi:hypothetical protein